MPKSRFVQGGISSSPKNPTAGHLWREEPDVFRLSPQNADGCRIKPASQRAHVVSLTRHLASDEIPSCIGIHVPSLVPPHEIDDILNDLLCRLPEVGEVSTIPVDGDAEGREGAHQAFVKRGSSSIGHLPTRDVVTLFAKS